MTREQAGKYAAQCYKAQTEARKNGIPYIKPERPDAYQLDHVETIARNNKKNIRALVHRMTVISDQMDLLLDFISDLSKTHSEYREYERIADYLNGSIIEINELLKTL